MHLFLTEGMGWLEVICGSMFSGKSEELIRRLRRAKYANQKVVAFKHASDDRYDDTKLASHSQNFIEGIPVGSVEEMEELILTKYCDSEVIGIDEVQFFGEKVVSLVEKLANMGKRVVVAGLDQDFRGEPFHPMPELLIRAEHVDKLNAICMSCGSPASRTQRLVNGEPAYYDDPIIMVGAAESYEARCRKCHIVKNREDKEGKVYFIVGTDTEIGKTFVTTKLVEDEIAKGTDVTVLKPIETGKETFPQDLSGSDTKAYADLLGKDLKDVNTYFFSKPMSPHIAAEIDGEVVSVKKIKEDIDRARLNHDVVYVEGAGGLLVPYKDKYTYLDLLVDYRKKAEVILVSANVLGTINHTLLTIDVLRRNDIKINGIVFNNKDGNTDEKLLRNNVETISRYSSVKVIKEVGYNGL